VADTKQTDYGNIIFKQPTEIIQTTSTEDLARRLKGFHEKGERVTIRNTAHSTFGQTLTDGVQVNIGGIEGVNFDKDAMTVTAGAGVAWNSVFKAIELPEYCTPIFPNNPGQNIQIGGTAAAGGVGYYGSHVGGFWNHVSSAKLVTMTGEIIECSRTENSELLRYALAGFGRIGVISEVTADVVKSKPRVLCMAMAYRNPSLFQADLMRALDDQMFNGVAAQEDVSDWHPPGGAVMSEAEQQGIVERILSNLKLLLVIIELEEDEDPRPVARQIRQNYPSAALVSYMQMDAQNGTVDITLTPTTFSKESIVYFYPAQQSFWVYLCNKISMFFFKRPLCQQPLHTNFKNPWCDCIVNRKCYTEFVTNAKEIISRHGMAKYLDKQSVFHGLVNIDSFVTFGLKRVSEEFYPLALDLPDELNHALGVAVMASVPPDDPDLLKRALSMARELTDYVYSDSIMGRRYLYGYNQLSRDQVERHYGRDALERWQTIKDELDPKHLLNIGVIPNLDE
jgi:FAD/FMN-containing dehydrogenase